jgi:hypothetical protein
MRCHVFFREDLSALAETRVASPQPDSASKSGMNAQLQQPNEAETGAEAAETAAVYVGGVGDMAAWQ